MTASLEDIKTIDIEEWLTLNTAASPTKLKQGQTPNAENVWVDEKPGSVITANGFLKVGTTPNDLPGSFCINYFKTSNGSQIFVVSDNATVWTTQDFQTFTSIITGLSSSFQLRGMVIRDKLWLTNGSDSVRTFDGTSVVVLDGTGGTPDVPKGRYIGFHDERVWLYHLPTDRSAVRFTALVDNAGAIIAPDNASAWPTDNQLQISEGDADFGTGLILYRGYLYAFKQYGIYRIIGYDEYTYSRVKTRASTGSRFSESLQIKDNLIHLVGVDGIYVFDGEDATRISDIIDPASASQAAFGFDDIQQPNTNNQFFQTTDTADWNAGTVPANLTVDNSIALVAADDSAADFADGATLTNVSATDNPGALQLSHSGSGVASGNKALNQSCSLSPASGFSPVGTASYVTDGNLTNSVGFSGSSGVAVNNDYQIVMPSGISFTRVILRSWVGPLQKFVTIYINGSAVTPSSVSGGTAFISGNNVFLPAGGTPTDYTINIPATSGTNFILRASGAGTLTDIEIYASAYNSTGQFVSKTLDLKSSLTNMGSIRPSYTHPAGTTCEFFTQTSNDGISWDVAVIAIASGSNLGIGPIGSTSKRYIRWGVNFTSTGLDTPSVLFVNLPSVFVSPIHDTGGSIFAWGPLEADYDLAGETVNFYYRAASTSGGVLAESWVLIVPGGVISSDVSNQYVQFKIEILGGVGLPSITSVTINWVSGTGTQPSTLQNVASSIWRNRYWLSVASSGATANDTIIVRGKKTADFDSPWQLKDWPILSFTRFHNDFYGCSSLDGSIYKLDTGYSKDGEAMDAFFETGDFVFGGFYVQLAEVLVEVERLGPYSLYVGVSTDQGATWTELPVDLTESTYAPTFIKRLNLSANSDRLRFRVRINEPDQPFQVHRLIAYYSLTKQRGSVR